MKIGALIPIRLSSERLPRKALIEICGRPIVYHLLDRVNHSRFLSKEDIVVCTTEDEEDNCLAETVEKYGCSVYRGSRDDIINRFYNAMIKHQFDAVIQVDGDDPLCDPEYMDMTMEQLLKDKTLDIVTCEGLPLGIASKSFTMSAINKVNGYYKTEKNDTGFIYYFTRTGLCKTAIIKPKGSQHILNEARLTLDYQVDLEVFKKIFDSLYVDKKIFTLEEVLNYLKSNQEVLQINSTLDEEYWRRTSEKAQLFYRDREGAIKKI